MLNNQLNSRKLTINTITANLAALHLIAEQNGLRLNRPKEFKICTNILRKSINVN